MVAKEELEQVEREFPCEGLKQLGDFMYGPYRIRLHGKDNETEYYVIRNTGKEIETYTFYDIVFAKAEFNKGVEHIVYMMTTSDLRNYEQKRSRYVKGSKAKFKKAKK